MKITDQTVLDMFIADEGMRLQAYKCPSGFTTVGIGRNLDTNGLTEEEAIYLFWHDFNRCHGECAKEFDFWPALDDARRLVLINMCFNLGITTLKTFKRTLEAIRTKQYEAASGFMLDSLWARQVGHRAVRLSKIMATGTL